MASCEKCWRNARGVAAEYERLIEERKEHPCTPEQQAGEGYGATKCPKCGRVTVHVYCQICMNPECDYEWPFDP